MHNRNQSVRVTKKIADLLKAHKATISGMSGFLHAPLIPRDGARAIDERYRVYNDDLVDRHNTLPASFVIETYWQALRIYALAHDIGHLPMSHAFENAIAGIGVGMEALKLNPESNALPGVLIKEANQRFSGIEQTQAAFYRLLHEKVGVERQLVDAQISKKHLHETRSYAILNEYLVLNQSISESFPDLDKKLGAALNDYAALIHNLSICIIYSICIDRRLRDEVSPLAFLYAMRQLVDGEVDGDRLDYTLRDCHSAGVSFGDFDLERIIGNALLLRPKQDQSELFAFGYGPRAVAGIEQFFEARYQSYKYLVHHRTASRSNIVMETLIEKLFIFSFAYPDSDCAYILERFGFVDLKYEGRGAKRSAVAVDKVLTVVSDKSERLDDASLRTLLHEVRQMFRDDGRTKQNNDPARSVLAQQIQVLSAIVLERALNHIVTVFKDYSVRDFLVDELGISDDERAGFLGHMKNELWRFFSRLNGDFFKQAQRGDEPVTLMYEMVSPKCFVKKPVPPNAVEDVVWIGNPRGGSMRIDDEIVSPSLKNMEKERQAGRRIRIYAAANNIKLNKKFENAVERALIREFRVELKYWRSQRKPQYKAP